ncbi:MAG: hypothetical protein QNK04_11765 [Myxococcota bacterium]|nr:hypothetical protein [Myxococcota bacterium]
MQFGDIQSLTMHGGNQHWIGVFRQGNDGHAFFSVTTYAAFLQAVEVNNGLGLRLVDVHVEQ